MEDKLIWFNGKGDALNFNFNEDLERYLNLGFSNVISKPYTIVNFVEKIK